MSCKWDITIEVKEEKRLRTVISALQSIQEWAGEIDDGKGRREQFFPGLPYVPSSIRCLSRARVSVPASPHSTSSRSSGSWGSSRSEGKGCTMTLQFVGGWRRVEQVGHSVQSDVMVTQVVRGGTPATLFKGMLSPQEIIQLRSRRGPGDSFTMAVYLDGLLSLRLSSCCEHRYKVGRRLGGPSGRFLLLSLQGASPCIRF
ncbi:unnamed protein product, partial [Darwinula stevensoni]